MFALACMITHTRVYATKRVYVRVNKYVRDDANKRKHAAVLKGSLSFRSFPRLLYHVNKSKMQSK